jgi:hypothetical protein
MFKKIKKSQKIKILYGSLIPFSILNHFLIKGQLADCQHGFVKGRSTVSNLLEYSSFVLKSIDGWVSDGFNPQGLF